MLPDTARTIIDDMPFLLVRLHEATFHAKDVIYVILDIEPDGDKRILDVDQSPEYGAEPIDHADRRACWLSHASTPDIYVGMYRLPSDRNMDTDRLNIIRHLRQKYRPPCTPVTQLPHAPGRAHPVGTLSASEIATPAPYPPLPRNQAPEIVDVAYVPEMP
jgi:hypothetical protein